MSDEICQNCGNPRSQCTCKPTEIIEVRHTGLPKNLSNSPTDPSKDELEATRAELETRKEQLKVIALRELEGKVRKFASVIPDEKKRKAVIDSIMNSDDPVGNFERKKEMFQIMRQALEVGGIGVKDDDIETPPPAGSGRGLPPRADQFVSGREIIDAIYTILENPKSTEQERSMARKRADDLVQQFISGRQKAIREDPKHKYYLGYVLCPKCGKSIPMARGEKRAKDCPHCNAILTRRVA